MFNPTREQVRQFFCGAWRKHVERLPLDGAEVTAADLIAEHPEYHALLLRPEEAQEKEFTPDGGQTNPFLHLSLHLAIAEQISIDQPPGILAAYQALRQRLDVHDAEHAIMECLGEALWRAQRSGGTLDGMQYLECVRRAAG
ncbi:DUF1841 family protein [Propionivibrio dicarboxylicus]|uniref:DUF1841 domain-containing protein n=1 Tax=Propionivibrio dicarboxylicus TaxID=83767 RepID=A0A1G8BXN3_9RHOO|nr:DUF1841 family protein [Propionivibrio dicarboxylicus]SDH37971.1 protein of unknown function [Propionivibrio dicarboxylicus]